MPPNTPPTMAPVLMEDDGLGASGVGRTLVVLMAVEEGRAGTCWVEGGCKEGEDDDDADADVDEINPGAMLYVP